MVYGSQGVYRDKEMNYSDPLQEYAVKLLERMVEINSPSGEESSLSYFLESKMISLGYEAQIDPAGNVVGKIGTGSPIILLSGHMDTVPLGPTVSNKDGYLYGRGAVDAKGALAAMIIAGKQIIDEGFKGSLIMACTVQEEGDNSGIRALIDSRVQADFAVFGEPTNTNTLTFAYKGCLMLKVRCMTEPGHSSAPWLYKNAIEESMEIYKSLKQVTVALSDTSEGFDAITVCIRSIEGGQNVGVIPSECVMIVEFRVPLNIDTGTVKEKIDKEISSYQNENPAVRIVHCFYRSVEPYKADKKSLLVRAFSRTIYDKFRKPVILVKKSGVGDMSYYGKTFDIPVITYGPGDAHMSHTKYERIKIDDFLVSIEIIKSSILCLEQLLRKTR